jgi:uncharacterized membrane protein
MNQNKVSTKRHLAKTITYRIISTLIGFLIVWGVSGKVEIGAAFGIIELIYKPIQYYIHERIWYRWISYGLVRVNPIKRVKRNNPRGFKETEKPTPPPSQIIKEGENPKPKKIEIEEESTLLTGLPEKTQEKIKRLTYTKKSDE